MSLKVFLLQPNNFYIQMKTMCFYMCINTLSTPMFHFTAASHFTKIIVLGTKSRSSLEASTLPCRRWSGSTGVQCPSISHECLPCVYFCFTLCKLCHSKTVAGIYFTFQWKDQFLGGKLCFAHYSHKLCLFYFCRRKKMTR